MTRFSRNKYVMLGFSPGISLLDAVFSHNSDTGNLMLPGVPRDKGGNRI